MKRPLSDLRLLGNTIDKEIATMSRDAPASPSAIGNAPPGQLPHRFRIETIFRVDPGDGSTPAGVRQHLIAGPAFAIKP